MRLEEKTEKELKRGFHCLPVQTVTEATAGKNTQLPWWKHTPQTGSATRARRTFHCGLSKRRCPLLARSDRNFFYCPEVRATMTSYIIFDVKGSTYASHLFDRPLCCIQPCFSKVIFDADLLIQPKSPENSTRFVFIFCIIQVYIIL